MLCYRCGGHVKDGAGKCVTCGQSFDPGLKAGPAAGFGAGIKRPRHAVEGAPYAAGDRVAGRYLIQDQAGSGPLGWMFRAVEIENDGLVALKVLSPRFLQMDEEKRTFAAELHKAQRLAHPNIARIYQAGEDGGRPFIAAQHLEGLTLRRIMDLRRQKGQQFTLQEVEPIVAQIAAALDAASASFAHGNLKPDNVIVLPDLLKLTDFGLAVSLPRAPFMAAQKAAGVHRYLAPEFLFGDPLDARTDVFSLGVLLAELLGGAPYEAQLSLLEKSPGLPEPVEALVRRAASPRPNARFATAGEMAAELSELVAGVPRPAPRAADDAGDVVIVEAHTDPRLRIARALGAARAPDPAETPLPPVPEAKALPPITQPDPPRAELVLPLDAAARAALGALPVAAPFTPPPPYQPSAFDPPPPYQAPPPSAFAAPVVAEVAPPEARSPQPEAAVEPLIAPVAEPSEELLQVAAALGAAPELLTAETAVRAAPSRPEPPGEAAGEKDRPRRGAGKRSKEKHARGRRRTLPPGAPGTDLAADPAWASSAPPPTEGALAIGPATSALSPIEPDLPRLDTPATPLAPVEAATPPARSETTLPPAPRAPSSSTSFAAPEEETQSRARLYLVGALALAVGLGAIWSLLPRSEAKSGDAGAAAKADAAAPPSKADAAKAQPPRAEPAKAAATQPAEVKADPVKTATAAPRREADTAHHAMRDRVRAVKDRVEKALEDRRRKRDAAVAASQARRQSEKSAPPAVAPVPPAAEKTAAAAEPAAAQPKGPPPPGGAITGLGDNDVLVSKDHGRAVASAVPAVYVPSAGGRDFVCAPGMVKVPGGPASVGSDASDDLRNFGDRTAGKVELKPYCIDQYEFPNQPGKLPRVAAPFAEAEALCKNSGKRLCSEDEWESACRGPQNLRFPYGTRFDPDACNTTDAKDNPRQTGVSGAFPKCRSGYNVFDLSGNAAEWTASAFDGQGADKAVKGGHAARPSFDDRCASRRKMAAGARAVTVGFRCCADAR